MIDVEGHSPLEVVTSLKQTEQVMENKPLSAPPYLLFQCLPPSFSQVPALTSFGNRG